MTRPAKTVVGAVRQDCPRCGAPTLRQTTGMPWTVIADAQPLTLAAALALVRPNRLAWCLRESKWSGPRLAECFPTTHRAECTQHIVDHECPPGTPKQHRPEGALW